MRVGSHERHCHVDDKGVGRSRRRSAWAAATVLGVEDSSASASKVSVYAAGKGGDIVAPILAWAEGNGSACPDL